MKYINLSVTLIISLLSFEIGFAQSPWVTKNSGYSHIAFGIIPSYDQTFNGGQNNLEDLNGEITEWSIQSYTEYGVTDKIGLIAEIPLRYISATVNDNQTTEREDGNITGLGNISLGMKYNILNRKFLITAQAKVSFNTSVSDEALGLRTDYSAMSITPTISIGKGGKKSYFYAYTGVALYGDNLSNNFVYGIEYGYHVSKKLLAIIALNGKESFNDGNRIYDDNFEETRLYVNNQLYHSLALRLIYEINKNMGINGSTNLISIRANKLPFQSPFSLGIYYKW